MPGLTRTWSGEALPPPGVTTATADFWAALVATTSGASSPPPQPKSAAPAIPAMPRPAPRSTVRRPTVRLDQYVPSGMMTSLGPHSLRRHVQAGRYHSEQYCDAPPAETPLRTPSPAAGV